jgi:hypothetical protein
MSRIVPGRRLAIAAALVATQALASSVELRLALSMSQISAPDYVPNLVLYSDGTLVRWDQLKRRFESCQLTESEATRLVNLPELRGLRSSYDISAVLEDRGWRLVFRDRGSMRSTAAHEASPDAERFNGVPERLLAFRCRKPVTWYPVRTELVFFPVRDDLPSPLVDYPRDWPSPTPVGSRYAGELRKAALHAYLEGPRFYELRRRVEGPAEPVETLVRVEGKNYVVRIRAPMRFEELWYGVPPEPDQQRP